MGTIVERKLDLTSDGLSLDAGACIVDEPRGTVVLLHGIPSVTPPDIGEEGYPGLARRFASRCWSAVWADMRGVRGSEGFFSIEGWVRDGIATVTAARALHPDVHFLALVGSSAGGAVSAEVARRKAPVDAVALLAAPAIWSSFVADPRAGTQRITIEAGMPLEDSVLQDPTAWAAEFDGVSTELSVGDVDVPILILHGTADEVVPVDHAKRIADQAPHAELEIIEGAEHVLRRDERAVERVLSWLDGLVS